jgi:hypothetical protein
MDISSLQRMVRESPLLSDEERAYWTANLPTMTLEQCGRLQDILGRAAALPWNKALEKYAATIIRAAARAATAVAPT